MTTEILRNIMYRTDDPADPQREDRLADVGLIVLDEVWTHLNTFSVNSKHSLRLPATRVAAATATRGWKLSIMSWQTV